MQNLQFLRYLIIFLNLLLPFCVGRNNFIYFDIGLYFVLRNFFRSRLIFPIGAAIFNITRFHFTVVHNFFWLVSQFAALSLFHDSQYIAIT